MDIMPQMTSQTNMSHSVTSQTVTTHESLPKIKKPT